MSSLLKEKLSTYIQEHHSSIGEFERKKHLKKNSIHYILTDKSKNPSLETVVSIADALGCSLDEMLGRNQFLDNSLSTSKKNLIITIELFKATCVFVNDFIDKNNLQTVEIDDALNSIKEICNYCSQKCQNKFDIKFSEWFLETYLIK